MGNQAFKQSVKSRHGEQTLMFHSIVWVVWVFALLPKSADSIESPLNGINLRCLPKEEVGIMETKRNESGYIIETSGVMPQLIDWLSNKYNFNYTLLQNVAKHTDDSQFGRGSVSYIISREADVVLSGNPPVYNRFNVVDFSTPWTQEPYTFLIPYPTPLTSYNFAAVIKPFRYEIWILLATFLPIVIFTLYGLNCALGKMSRKKVNNQSFSRLAKTYEYAINVLTGQGDFCSNTKLAIRLLAGTWCLACFVLTTAYSSVLISYVISPGFNKPIINSMSDIPKVPGLLVTTDKGSTLETVFLSASINDSYNLFGKQLKANPSLRCNKTEDCVHNVLSGRRIYPNSVSQLAEIMNKDHLANGKCRLTMAKIPFLTPRLCLILRKNSPYTETINRGILEWKQFGLDTYWKKKFFAQPDECLNQYEKPPGKQPISLKNLSGAFVILLLGYSVALLVFLIEKTVYYHRQNRRIHNNEKP